ncbi:MAG: hypothetical protein A2504_14465 [Bdellovibrionales bacterium RIFOXYD12_FULL_39_22]|nr:MAG: hypothetical protein A2385_04900 [Bdellovibrionales bacterium RIFOXYB1_FULL_39_21]OFZ43485.1 MAG: hypothetical protein A2485_13415 [Bdellovibrionales bacterium RIFOXYC12_FULL_39_17]OFZ47028.1 MAG: hypothetical protein A2404_00475 [Bdellovibrionales bacterium RIFOXYC1_FULL_39_130]OFZ71305.1 MAG: hypothetical protein A2451_15505 [Bdellovibrionales bacterium RIFOXYC2_FULL_39_8]OFZ76225.1 MAG: hypothetical protein A2560_07725 [Bdellovibrionales bacterium RIFOXYD1_FULL_39_84]OFZ94460.1 MAG:
MKIDLHVHTKISRCSNLPWEDILNNAKLHGLDGVCITDHHSMEIKNYISEGILENGLCVIFGMEYSTDDGDFLVFGPYENLPMGLSAEKLLKHINQSGGVAIVAHPFRASRPASERVVASGLCKIVEAINGGNRVEENDAVKKWKERYDIKLTGGSDAHALVEMGRAATIFDDPISSRQELILALKNGNYRPVSF